MKVCEGEQKLLQHLSRERNSQIVKQAKEFFKIRNNGRLFCEVCGFDFYTQYGDIGDNFIEAHHKKPVSKMISNDFTTINDFIMVCSNCHSMLHVGEEWLTCEDLKLRIKTRFNN